jgi:hypothetical protein
MAKRQKRGTKKIKAAVRRLKKAKGRSSRRAVNARAEAAKAKQQTGNRKREIESAVKLFDEPQINEVARPALDVRVLTEQEIASGKTHHATHIEAADMSIVPLPLRNHRDAAFIISCYCALCEERRTRHFASK